jgi:hypothetical protein
MRELKFEILFLEKEGRTSMGKFFLRGSLGTRKETRSEVLHQMTSSYLQGRNQKARICKKWGQSGSKGTPSHRTNAFLFHAECLEKLYIDRDDD